MMLARCPGDPLQILLLYGVMAAGTLLAAGLLAWGMGGRGRR
jgi:hypothetical protein